MRREIRRQRVAEVPTLGDSVQAGCDNVEVSGLIVSRAGVALGGARALEIDPRPPVLIPRTAYVFALDQEWRAALPCDA